MEPCEEGPILCLLLDLDAGLEGVVCGAVEGLVRGGGIVVVLGCVAWAGRGGLAEERGNLCRLNSIEKSWVDSILGAFGVF